MPSSRPAML